jgi:hypothetical protein
MRRAAELSAVVVPAFLLGAVALVWAAGATGEPAAAAVRMAKAPSAFGPEAQAQSAALRRREIDELRRKDLAAALARFGEPARWQDHSQRELAERRARAEAAEALRSELGVTVDWHKLTLEELLDLRVRGAKGAELANTFGVAIDWQRYSWIELEALLRTVRRMGPRAQPAGPNAREAVAGKAAPAPLLSPTFVGRAERGGGGDRDAVLAPTFGPRPAARGNERDPDAVIRPRFANRPAGREDGRDPDAVLRPRFVGHPVFHRGDGPDDLISPTFAERQGFAARARFTAVVGDPDDVMGPSFAVSGR